MFYNTHNPIVQIYCSHLMYVSCTSSLITPWHATSTTAGQLSDSPSQKKNHLKPPCNHK